MQRAIGSPFRPWLLRKAGQSCCANNCGRWPAESARYGGPVPCRCGLTPILAGPPHHRSKHRIAEWFVQQPRPEAEARRRLPRSGEPALTRSAAFVEDEQPLRHASTNQPLVGGRPGMTAAPSFRALGHAGSGKQRAHHLQPIADDKRDESHGQPSLLMGRTLPANHRVSGEDDRGFRVSHRLDQDRNHAC